MKNIEITYSGDYKAKKYPDAVFHYEIYVPKDHNDNMEYGLIFNHDGLSKAEAAANEVLAKNGNAPHCISVGIDGGCIKPTIEKGTERILRMNTYDFYSNRFPDFVVDEFLPYLIEKYNLKIDPSPDMHIVSGGSSGGISSWNIAWNRTDYFKRVYMSSPSFLEMAKGQELVTLMRKFEPKPIRVFNEYYGDEPNDYFGSSFCVAKAAEMALEFAGYDMMNDYFPDEWHCDRRLDYEKSLERLEFLWKDWENEPIKVKKISPRMEKVFSISDDWNQSEDVFPEKIKAVSTGAFTPKGEYVAEGDRIVFVNEAGERKNVAEGFSEITSLLISSDKWRVYIGDKRRGCVYAANIQKDGTLSDIYVHATLHLNTDFKIPGVFDMCLDSEDRIYAATEIGIQTIRSFGLIDVILANPNNEKVNQIEFDDNGFLVAQANGKIYKRKLCNKKRAEYNIQTAPTCCWYYD